MLTEAQKSRISIAIGHMRREPSWQTLRQFCLAESANEVPEPEELKGYILGLFDAALSQEIQNGFDQRAK